MNKREIVILLLALTLACGANAATKKPLKPAKKAPIKIEAPKLTKSVLQEPIRLEPKRIVLEAPVEQIRIGGQIFFRWQKYLTSGGPANNFDVDRAYIDLKKNLDRNAMVRLTLDVARLDTTKLDTNKKSQQLYDFLKYAYVELPVYPDSLTAKIGLQQTVWIDWMDKILGLRFIAKSLVDNEGVMPSADFGAGAAGKVGSLPLPDTEYQVTVLNGSGFKTTETDSQKNIAARLNTTLCKSDSFGRVFAGVYGQIGSSSTKQAGATIAIKQERGAAYLEYLYGTGIAGYSLGGIYQFIPGWNFFARLDNYNPSRSVANDQIDRSFYGLIYDWGKDIKLAADVQSTTSAGTTTSILYFHTLVNI